MSRTIQCAAFSHSLVYFIYSINSLAAFIFRIADDESSQDYRWKALARFICIVSLHIVIFIFERAQYKPSEYPKGTHVSRSKEEKTGMISLLKTILVNLVLIIIYEETSQQINYESLIVYLLNFSSRSILEKGKKSVFFWSIIGNICIPFTYLIIRGEFHKKDSEILCSETSIRFERLNCILMSFFVIILVSILRSITEPIQPLFQMRTGVDEDLLEASKSDPSGLAQIQQTHENPTNPFLQFQINGKAKTREDNNTLITENHDTKKTINNHEQSKRLSTSKKQNTPQIGGSRLLEHQFSIEAKQELSDIFGASSIHNPIQPGTTNNTQTFGQILLSGRAANTGIQKSIVFEQLPKSLGNIPFQEKGMMKSQQLILTKQVSPIIEEEFDHQSLLLAASSKANFLSSHRARAVSSDACSLANPRTTLKEQESEINWKIDKLSNSTNKLEIKGQNSQKICDFQQDLINFNDSFSNDSVQSPVKQNDQKEHNSNNYIFIDELKEKCEKVSFFNNCEIKNRTISIENTMSPCTHASRSSIGSHKFPRKSKSKFGQKEFENLVGEEGQSEIEGNPNTNDMENIQNIKRESERKSTFKRDQFSFEESISKAFFNFFPEGVAFMDDNMDLIYANDSLKKLFNSELNSLKEKLCVLNNDVKVSELSRQKSSNAQRFLIRNIIHTDQHIQTPKQSITNINFNTNKIKSHSNILYHELPKLSNKFSGVMAQGPISSNVSQYSQSNQTQRQTSFQQAMSSKTFQSANNNNNPTQNQLTSILFLQNPTPKPNLSMTSFYNAQQNNNYPVLQNNQSFKFKRQLQLEKENKMSDSFPNNFIPEEPLFASHFQILDSSGHINVAKKQAILPDLNTEISFIIMEIKRYIEKHPEEQDYILDKAFTFTSRLKNNNNNPEQSVAGQNLNTPNINKEGRTSISDKLFREDSMRRSKKINKPSTPIHSSLFHSSSLTSNGVPLSSGNYNVHVNGIDEMPNLEKQLSSSKSKIGQADIPRNTYLYPSDHFFPSPVLKIEDNSSIIAEESNNNYPSPLPPSKHTINKLNQNDAIPPTSNHEEMQESPGKEEIDKKIEQNKENQIKSETEISNPHSVHDTAVNNNTSTSGLQNISCSITFQPAPAQVFINQKENILGQQNVHQTFLNTQSDITSSISPLRNTRLLNSDLRPIENKTHTSLLQLNTVLSNQEQSYNRRDEEQQQPQVEYSADPNNNNTKVPAKNRQADDDEIQIKERNGNKKQSKEIKSPPPYSSQQDSCRRSPLQEDKEWGEDGERIGKERELDISIFSYVLNGKPVILLLVRDVTHRSYIKLLQDVSKKKSKMVSFVSHELRTPLNSIIAMLETMKKHPQIDYIETALMNSKYLLCISNDLLDLAQIKVNKFQIRKKCFNFKELVIETMEMFTIQAERQEIELIVDYQPTVQSFLTSDKNRIRQVLINLLGNAFKFTLNGSITIQVRKLESALLEVSVLDTGIGIKEGDLNKLFKTFGKLDGEESVKLNEQGVGLGLVISNMIAFSLSEDQEGLKVNSEYNKGTSFKFKVLDWDVQQSQSVEEQLKFHLQQDEEDADMKVEAEENEGNCKLPYDNVNQRTNYGIHNNKFTDKNTQKESGLTLSLKTQITPLHILHSPSKKSNNDLKSLRGGDSQNITSLSRLMPDFQAHWAEKKKIGNRGQASQHEKEDYSVLSFNAGDSISHPFKVNKLTKMATQINIKAQWGQILVVDDNMSNIVAMKCLINLINPEFLCNYAIRGQGAEDLVKNRFFEQGDEGYSIIFMDIVMPEQDGIITARNIAAFLEEKGLKKTKIIACSGYDDDSEKKQCLEAGMIDYLVKPVFKEKLASVIKTYI